MSDKLKLEILSGPLDGAIVELEGNAELSKTGEGALMFPWDDELGEPQARFTLEGEDWFLEGAEAPHGTYRINREERISAKVQLECGDLLKASSTWLSVRGA